MVLLRAYPTMVPELMSYQATIIKCARDFDGLAWAQYDRVYHRQMAQTKDLQWSRLNPTLYSLCFVGKAKRHIIYSSCLSDNHTTKQCSENPSSVAAASMSWFDTLVTPQAPAYHQEKLCNLSVQLEGLSAIFNSASLHTSALCVGIRMREPFSTSFRWPAEYRPRVAVGC